MNLIEKIQTVVDQEFPDLHSVALGDITTPGIAHITLNIYTDVQIDALKLLEHNKQILVRCKVIQGLLVMSDLIDDK